MVFYTISQSAYEVDLVRRRVRRLRGATEPLPRMGKDGEWREYAWISPIKPKLRVLIRWTDSVESAPGTVPTTLTSMVERVIADEN